MGLNKTKKCWTCGARNSSNNQHMKYMCTSTFYKGLLVYCSFIYPPKLMDICALQVGFFLIILVTFDSNHVHSVIWNKSLIGWVFLPSLTISIFVGESINTILMDVSTDVLNMCDVPRLHAVTFIMTVPTLFSIFNRSIIPIL